MDGLTKCWQRGGWLTFSLLLLFTAAGCGGPKKSAIPDALSQQCVVIRISDTAWNNWLDRHMPHATRYESHQMDEAIRACRDQDLVLVVPGTGPNDDRDAAIASHQQDGGKVLLLGEEAPPLFAPVQQRGAFRIQSSRFRIDEEFLHAGQPAPTLTINSPHPLPPGYGGPYAPDHRWIPVVEVVRPNDQVMGWAGSVTLMPAADLRHAITGWLGFNPPPLAGDKLAPFVMAMLETITREAYLYRYGVDRLSADTQTPLRAQARVIPRRGKDATVRLSAMWVNARGTEVRRHVSPPVRADAGEIDWPIGLAPEPSGGRPEVFTVTLAIRDRNDQRTLDTATQPVKVFPRGDVSRSNPVQTHRGMLMQDRVPLFLLGVNYWPRLFGPPAEFVARGHWLYPEYFHPATLTRDLDLMVAAGLNAIAIEYIDISQAPQLLFVLDELRKRSMLATLYLPALYPLDLRLDAALPMLNAIRLKDWPEVVALEVARGIAVRPREEMRRLDTDWADWINERFGSISEAEQKTGARLRRERDRLVGPDDEQLQAGPRIDRFTSLYYVFLRDYASRRIGYTQRILRREGYTTLLTARSAYGWPDGQPGEVLDTLDISTGAIHLDFLSPEAWTIHPLNSTHQDGSILAAYVRGISGGKPVVWSAFGQDAGSALTPDALARQKDVAQHYLDAFLAEGSSGAFVWRYAAPQTAGAGSGWSLVWPQGTWRTVEESLRATRLALRSFRATPPSAVRVNAPVMLSAREFIMHQQERTGIFAARGELPPVTWWQPAGSGMDSRQIFQPAVRAAWTPVEGMHVLNAEWGSIASGSRILRREPGEQVKTYAGETLEFELINSGSIAWAGAEKSEPGTVWMRITQPDGAPVLLPLQSISLGERQIVTWTPRTAGPWELQTFLDGYGKFGERLRLDVSTPPRLF